MLSVPAAVNLRLRVGSNIAHETNLSDVSETTDASSSSEDCILGMVAHGANSPQVGMVTRLSRRSESAAKGARNRIHQAMARTDRLQSKTWASFGLAISIGFWSAFFGLPAYSLWVHEGLFGMRDMGGEFMRQLNYSLQTNVSAGRMAANLIGETRRDDNYSGNVTHMTSVLIRKLQASCPSTCVGRWRNMAAEGEEPWLERWNESEHGAWDKKNASDIWCGFLPAVYLSNWPTMSKLIIFTLSRNRGSTIKEALQGVIGTSFACLNVFAMTKLYPQGGRSHMCISLRDGVANGQYTVVWQTSNGFEYKWHQRQTKKFEKAIELYGKAAWGGGLTGRAIVDPKGEFSSLSWFPDEHTKNEFQLHVSSAHTENCTAGAQVMNDSYNEWVSFLDTFVVLLLFLISGSGRTTMIYGMSWHVFFMMEFMDPSKGATPVHWANTMTSVFFISVMGALLAVIMTLVPCLVVTNLGTLYEDTLRSTHSIIQVWSDSIKYLAGSARNATCYRIERQIDDLSELGAHCAHHAEGAWWETFNQGRGAQRRLLLSEFAETAIDIKDMLQILKGCVAGEKFDGRHWSFMQAMTEAMENLKNRTSELMYLSLQSISDGVVSETEAVGIVGHVEKVKTQQLALLDAFQSAAPDVCMDLAEEQTFVYVLSFWARRITDFAERVVDVEATQEARRNVVVTLFVCMRDGIVKTWSPSKICTFDKVYFAARNWVAICLCYLMGYYFQGSIFTRYNAAMASNLCVLIGYEGAHGGAGSMMEKNTQRIVGVSLGKVLPILICCMLVDISCFTLHRLFVQFGLIWLYVSTWVYVMFTSEMWSYVGCLIASFGLPTFMVPCAGSGDENEFSNRYQEIGNLVVAIVVQAIVHSLTSTNSPVTLEVTEVRLLCEECTKGFEAFFASDTVGMMAAAKKASDHLTEAKKLAPECDSKLLVAPLPGHSPFRIGLCTKSLSNMELVISDLNMLICATKDWVPNERLNGICEDGGDDNRHEHDESEEDTEDSSDPEGQWPTRGSTMEMFRRGSTRSLSQGLGRTSTKSLAISPSSVMGRGRSTSSTSRSQTTLPRGSTLTRGSTLPMGMRSRARVADQAVIACASGRTPGLDKGILEFMNEQMAMQSISEDLLAAMEGVTSGLPAMLDNAISIEQAEGKLRRADTVRAARTLQGAEDLYAQLSGAQGYNGAERRELTNDLRVRLAVALRALENAAFHISSIEEDLLKENLRPIGDN